MTTINLPIPASLVTTANDPTLAQTVLEQAARARAELGEQLDGLCQRNGLDPWEAWRRPSRHAQIEKFRQSIRHLSPDDALSRPMYVRSAA